MVEVTLWCLGGHEFVQEFNDPVDWNKVNAAVGEKEPRCKDHQIVYAFDYNDCYGD